MRRMFLALVVAGLISSTGFANQNFSATYNNDTTLPNTQVKNTTAIKEGVITVPAGVSFKGVFLETVSSETAYGGQEVTMALVNDFYYNNVLVAPAGSTVTGSVIGVSKAKHGSICGKLTLRFTHILTPAGFDIPISALVRTADGSGTLLGGKNLGYATINGPMASETIGARDFAPPYLGVRPGTGAAMTTAVETGGGSLLKSIWDKGEDVEISVNSGVELILTQPITISPVGNQNK